MKGGVQGAHGMSNSDAVWVGGSGRAGRALSQCSNWHKPTDIPDPSFSSLAFLAGLFTRDP